MMEWKSVGMMKFPTEWKNNTCSKSPTSHELTWTNYSTCSMVLEYALQHLPEQNRSVLKVNIPYMQHMGILNDNWMTILTRPMGWNHGEIDPMTSLNIRIYLTNMVNWDIYRTPEKDKVRKFWLNCRHIIYIIYIYIQCIHKYIYICIETTKKWLK